MLYIAHTDAETQHALEHSDNNTLLIGLVTIAIIVGLALAFRLLSRPEDKGAKPTTKEEDS